MSAAAMPFKSRVERFLVERHGLGFSARSEACTLRSFARHLHETRTLRAVDGRSHDRLGTPR